MIYGSHRFLGLALAVSLLATENREAQAEPVAPATPEAAAEWARSLPDNARGMALNGIVAGWAELDPPATARWVSGLKDVDSWLFDSIARSWVDKDPQAAVQWAEGLSDKSQKNRVMQSLAQSWAVKNQAEAVSWAEKIPDAKEKAAALEGVARSWAQQNPEAALKWAEGQTDPALKDAALKGVIYGWCFKDRAAAEKWVESLPEGEQKKTLKETLQNAPVIRRRVIPATGNRQVKEEKIKLGEMAPGFAVKTLEGKEIKLEDYKGKYVLLDFWATWCGPCRGETPNLKAVFEKYGKRDDFVMIGLSLDQEASKPLAYAKENKCEWVDGFLGDWGKDEVTKKYGVHGIPSIWLIGPDGKIVAKGLRGDGILSAVGSALDQKK